ncbi:peptidase [Acetobacteraceae bacterium]|nr:peptidase [Acetobacteraceae bacterium]
MTQTLPPFKEMTLGDIPPLIGLLPLKRALLLPQGQLPLGIFDQEAASSLLTPLLTTRLIGIVQPALDDAEGKFEDIGTIGRLTSFREFPDGKLTLSLTGICRFNLLSTRILQNGGHEGKIDPSAFGGDFIPAVPPPLDRKMIKKGLKNWLGERHLAANWESINGLSNEALLTTLPMLLPFEPMDQQALLEAPGLEERAKILLEILMKG